MTENNQNQNGNNNKNTSKKVGSFSYKTIEDNYRNQGKIRKNTLEALDNNIKKGIRKDIDFDDLYKNIEESSKDYGRRVNKDNKIKRLKYEFNKNKDDWLNNFQNRTKLLKIKQKVNKSQEKKRQEKEEEKKLQQQEKEKEVEGEENKKEEQESDIPLKDIAVEKKKKFKNMDDNNLKNSFKKQIQEEEQKSGVDQSQQSEGQVESDNQEKKEKAFNDYVNMFDYVGQEDIKLNSGFGLDIIAINIKKIGIKITLYFMNIIINAIKVFYDVFYVLSEYKIILLGVFAFSILFLGGYDYSFVKAGEFFSFFLFFEFWYPPLVYQISVIIPVVLLIYFLYIFFFEVLFDLSFSIDDVGKLRLKRSLRAIVGILIFISLL